MNKGSSLSGLYLFFHFLILGVQNVAVYSQGLQKEWMHTYSADPAKNNGPVAALVAPDGCLVVAGVSESATGDKDYQVIKYRSNGQEVWRATYASPTAGTADVVLGMTIDPNGNVIVTGYASTVKFNSAGQQIWSVPVGARAVVADSQYVYVTGLSNVDIVTAQLQNNATDGKENWRKILDGTSHQTDVGQVITLDAGGSAAIFREHPLFWFSAQRPSFFTRCGRRQSGAFRNAGRARAALRKVQRNRSL